MAQGVAEYAKENNLNMHIHASEEQREQDECITRRGMTPISYFSKCGLLDTPATIAHCVTVTQEDMCILKEKNATVAHCPSSNFKLGCGTAPIYVMDQAGIRIGIGTDGAASNNNLNMLEEMKLAALAQANLNHNP